MAGGGQANWKRAGAAAIAASIAAHIVFGVALVWRLVKTGPAQDPPVIALELAPPFPLEPRAPSRPSQTATTPEQTTERPRMPEVLTSLPDAVIQDPPTVVQGDPHAALRRALRGRLGCERAALYTLTAEERRRCEERQAVANADVNDGPAPKFDLSKGGVFTTKDEAPYLARKPKNGCKVMAGGRATPAGEDAPIAGVGCSFAF